MKYPKARLWLLLISSLLSGPMSWAQDGSVGLNDLNLVLGAEPYSTRDYLLAEMDSFTTTHQLHLLITLLDQEDVYTVYARQDEDALLAQAAPALVITTWHQGEGKYYQRCEVQVNEALSTRLPQATAQQLVEEMLDYYGKGDMMAQDAMNSGLTVALLKLSEYLNALPPPEATPTITFANAPAVGDQPALGLDALTYEALRTDYPLEKINEEDYAVAWKALPSRGTTLVLAQVAKGVSFPPGVVFRQDGNTLSAQPAARNHQQQLTLTGQMHEQEGSLEVYANSEEDAQLVGKLRTISYDVLYKRLVLVVLDDVTSDALYLDKISRKVQATLAQAGVSLTIEIQKFDTGWGDREVPLEDETSGMLSNYPKELKRVIKDYRQEHEQEAETAYIFLAGSSSTGKLGYMPKKRPYGFVYLNAHYYAKEVAKTMAHELGHGLFRLAHTFEAYPALSKGSTDNLMDYGKGTRLHKYQWDLVHDPKAMLGWFQDEEENALDICFWAKSLLTYNSLFGEEHVLTLNMPMYNEVRDNFDSYWNQSEELFKGYRFGNDKEDNLALQSNGDWTIRNASHYRKTDSTMFVDHAIKAIVNKSEGGVTLHKEGVTLAKIKLEGKNYKLAAYSTAHNIKPSYIRVGELCDLVDNKNLQVYNDDGQSFIAFLKGGIPELVIQILTDDEDDVEIWLKYLGILVAEEPEWMSEIPPFWEKWTWNNVSETFGNLSNNVQDDIYKYIVTDDNALIRTNEPPFTSKQSRETIALGEQTLILDTLSTTPNLIIVRVIVKSSGDTLNTSVGNLTEIVNLSEERTYSILSDYEALSLPYSSYKASFKYKKSDEIIAYKECRDYVKIKNAGEDVRGHWVSKYILKIKNAELLFTTEELKENYPNVDELVVKDIFTFIHQYRFDYGIDNCEKLIHFLSQADHESGGFYYTIEQETFSGNRETYKGRGIFQLTFQSNYESFQEHLKTKGISVDLVNNPEIVEQAQFSVLSALWYWQRRKLSSYATGLQETNLLKISKLINCGNLIYCGKTTDKDGKEMNCTTCLPNGWDDRKEKLKLYKDEIDCK